MTTLPRAILLVAVTASRGDERFDPTAALQRVERINQWMLGLGDGPAAPPPDIILPDREKLERATPVATAQLLSVAGHYAGLKYVHLGRNSERPALKLPRRAPRDVRPGAAFFTDGVLLALARGCPGLREVFVGPSSYRAVRCGVLGACRGKTL